jgi:hypothetical protein
MDVANREPGRNQPNAWLPVANAKQVELEKLHEETSLNSHAPANLGARHMEK